MSNETRRQSLIVVAFLLVALAAVSPFVLTAHMRGTPPLQGDRLPINVKPLQAN